MTTFRRLPPLAVLMTLALSPVGASTIPIDPGQQVAVIEAPPTFGSCNPPISVMSNLRVGSQGADFTVTNGSTKRAQDVLTIDLIVNGQRRLFWAPVDLPSRSSASITIRFLTSVVAPVIGLCGNKPGGIVESPDPVCEVVVVYP